MSEYGEGFVALSTSSFLRTPASQAKPSGRCIEKEPTLIMVSSWLDAAPKHVSHYILGLRRLFPTSQILLVVTKSWNLVFQPNAQRLAELQPAIDVLKNVQPNTKVLLHSFSNAGAITSWQISRYFHAQNGRALPISKVVFDSSPGSADYSVGVRAFSVALPKNYLINTLGMITLKSFFGIWWLVEQLSRTTNIVNLMRAGLNDPKLLPLDAARLYIYSFEDQLVPCKDVELHMVEAEKLGYNVRRVCYVDSQHVAHLVQDEKRYWTAVASLWDGEYLSGPGTIVNAW